MDRDDSITLPSVICAYTCAAFDGGCNLASIASLYDCIYLSIHAGISRDGCISMHWGRWPQSCLQYCVAIKVRSPLGSAMCVAMTTE